MKLDPWLTFQVLSSPVGGNTELVTNSPFMALAPTTSGLQMLGLSLGLPAGSGGAAGEVAVCSTGAAAAATYSLVNESGSVGAPARFASPVGSILVGFGTSNVMAAMVVYDAVSQRWRRVG